MTFDTEYTKRGWVGVAVNAAGAEEHRTRACYSRASVLMDLADWAKVNGHLPGGGA